jgi:hypothetical protein
MSFVDVLAHPCILRRRAARNRPAEIENPIGFIGNLINALKRGFQQFSGNILTHLKAGLVGWLFGALTGAGLQLPERFDLRGIVSLVMQILGLTYTALRTILVRLIGEENVSRAERVFEFLMTIVTQGISAAWQRIVEFAGNLQEMVMGGIRDWVARTIVGQAITRLVTMFNPAGAIIQAIMAIYNTVVFFIERAQQIRALVEAVFSSIATIASGNIGAAANYVEQTMARTIPVMISFLARLIGLGGISDQIRNVVRRIQEPINRAMERVANWIVTQLRRLGGAIVSGARGVVQSIGQWWRARKEFTASNGEQHALYFQGEEATAELMIASHPINYQRFIDRLKSSNKARALDLVSQLEAVKARPASSFKPNNPKETIVAQLIDRIAVATGELLTAAGPGANAYPGSGLDPITRSNADLWKDVLPDRIPGATETSGDIDRRRFMARQVLLQRYSGGGRNIAAKILDFNLGREIRAFDLQRNESENAPDAHVKDRHVLNGSGRISDAKALALRALLNRPALDAGFVASAYLSANTAETAIRLAISSHMGSMGGWTQFREHIINNSGNNVLPGSVPTTARTRLLQNPMGAVLPLNQFPAYLNGFTFEGVSIAGATGTRPLYPGDPDSTVSGTPLTIDVPFSGKIFTNMQANGSKNGGWWVITSYPLP